MLEFDYGLPTNVNINGTVLSSGALSANPEMDDVYGVVWNYYDPVFNTAFERNLRWPAP
jgi:hypothetical protein